MPTDQQATTGDYQRTGFIARANRGDLAQFQKGGDTLRLGHAERGGGGGGGGTDTNYEQCLVIPVRDDMDVNQIHRAVDSAWSARGRSGGDQAQGRTG